MTAKLTPAQKSFAAHYRRQHGSDWFSVPYNYNQLRIAGNLVKKGVLQRRMDKVSGQHEYRFTPDAKYKVDDRVHHDGLCLTVTDVAFSDLMNEYSYAVRKTDGGLMPFFMRLLESELKPCDCKPTTKAAALPAAATLTVSEPFGIQFAEGDQVRVNRTRMLSYVQEVRGEDVRLENGNWYHLGELTLFRKAPEKALCSVCEEYRAGIVTRDGVDICQHCTAKAEAPFQVGDWVREKGHPVNVGQITDIITHETGLISHPVTVRFKTTFYRFNLWNARDLEPVDPPVSFVLIGRGELSTARRPVKIAGLLPAPYEGELIPLKLRPKMYLPALPGKFQRGETVLTVHGSGKVLGLAAPGLYHVHLRDGQRVIGREEYMSHEHPMKHWNIPGESWASSTEQFCQHMAAFQRRNAEELAKVKAEILARQENNQ